MNLISVDTITKYQGDKLLFSDVSFGIQEGEKVALIGVNGCGKTTLLNIMTGELAVDSGQVSHNNTMKVSKLAQIPEYNPDQTVLDHIFSSDDPKVQLIKNYEKFVASGKDNPDTLQKLIEEIEHFDAWSYEYEIKAILSQLGIVDLDRKMAELSGGMLKKVALAQALILESDLLILDEPTNHLDIDTIVWLEDYLKKTTKAIVMVTHDRYFLESICTSIYEIENRKFFLFKGNYTNYLRRYEERELARQKEENRVQTILKQELAWLNRGARARTTKAKARIQHVDELMNWEKPEVQKELEIEIMARRLGKKILELEDVTKSFDRKTVFKPFTYAFKKKARIGIVGPNGSGKSTFLNVITGNIEPDSGKIDVGVNTFFGYFDQGSLELDPEMRLIDFVKKTGELLKLSDGSELTPTVMLERFLFKSELHFTPVGKLSGGEKRRLYLLHILMQNPNFIILDEPTNDLDIKTLSILEDFLQQFNGCLIVVSHDRYFLDRTVDHLFVFDENGNIGGFVGNVTDYIAARNVKKSEEKSQKVSTVKKHVKPRELEKNKRLSFKEKRELEQLEHDIDELEIEKATLETKLSGGETDIDKLTEFGKRFDEISVLLDEKMERWALLSEKE